MHREKERERGERWAEIQRQERGRIRERNKIKNTGIENENRENEVRERQTEKETHSMSSIIQDY